MSAVGAGANSRAEGSADGAIQGGARTGCHAEGTKATEAAVYDRRQSFQSALDLIRPFLVVAFRRGVSHTSLGGGAAASQSFRRLK